MSKVAWDSSNWGRVFTYGSLEDAISRSFYPEGVHRIPLDDGRFQELWFRGNPLSDHRDSPILVILPGALSSREGTSGPYFSGKSLSDRLDRSIISISDPIIIEDPEINIGWYTGRPGSNAQRIRAEFFSHLADVTDRELLLVSGSAGGFGALELAARIPASRLMIWNPQTNLVEYAYPAVSRYLNVALAKHWEMKGDWRQQATARLARTDIHFDVRNDRTPSRGIILQNDVDWHLPTHMAPYLRGRSLSEIRPGYVGDEKFGVVVLHMGKGHARPGPEIVDLLTTYLLTADATGLGAYELLVKHGHVNPDDTSMYPLDLASQSQAVQSALQVTAVRDGSKVKARISPEVAQRWPSARVAIRLNSSTKAVGYMTQVGDNDFELDAAETGLRVHVFVKDKLEQEIATITELVDE